MRILRKNEWTLLPQVKGDVFVSIYLDAAVLRVNNYAIYGDLFGYLKHLVESQADFSELPTKFNTQLNDAARWLERAPVREGGLALFLSRKFSGCMKLPFAPVCRAHIGRSFHVKPVVSMIATGVCNFWVLRLGPEDICYYKCDERMVQRITWVGIEGSNLSNSASERATRVADEAEQAMPPEIWHSRRPLVLAGPPFLRSRFRALTTYRFCTKEGFSAESGIPRQELHQKAVSCLEHHVAEDVWDGLSEFAEAATRGAAVTDLVMVGRQLAEGKASLLFVAADTKVIGQFNSKDGHIALGKGGDDVLDDLAEEAARKNIRVIALPRSHMPQKQRVAAVLHVT